MADAKVDVAQTTKEAEGTVTQSDVVSADVFKERVSKLSAQKRIANEERDALRTQVEQLQNELYQLRNSPATSSSTIGTDEDTGAWIGRILEEKLDRRLQPLLADSARTQAEARFDRFAASEGKWYGEEVLEMARDAYMNQMSTNPAMLKTADVKAFANWAYGELASAVQKERGETAVRQQQVMSSTPVSTGEVMSRTAPEQPVDKTSREYINQATSDDLFNDLEKNGYTFGR